LVLLPKLNELLNITNQTPNKITPDNKHQTN
jgi:hypothetical protein